jgi:uncharacterized protein (TIGR02246 family)
MKIRLLLALVGLAIGFAVPAFAQQKDTVDPQTIEQLDALTKKFMDFIDNNDAAAVTAVFTEDAIFVTPHGPVYGREAIEKFFADVFKRVHFSNHLAKADSNSIRFLGTAANEVWRNGEFSETEALQGQTGGPMQIKGYWSAVEVREGDAWKHRMCTFNITPPRAAETK